MPEIQILRHNDIHRRGRHTHDWAVGSDWCPALRTRGILAAGYTQLGLGYQILRYSPDFPHIGACFEDGIDYFADGKWQPAATGTILIAPAGQAHGSRRVHPKTRPGKTAWVLFDPYAKRPSYAWDRGPTRTLTGRDIRPLDWALQGLYVEANAVRGRHATGDAAVGQWCDLVVTTALRLVADQSASDVAMLNVWEQIDANLAHPWSTSELARLAGFSETHFRRQCRVILGKSTGRQLTHLRMQRAAMLISTTRDKLQTIADAVGYSDVFAFSVAFKRWSGQAPSTYRHTPTKPLSS